VPPCLRQTSQPTPNANARASVEAALEMDEFGSEPLAELSLEKQTFKAVVNANRLVHPGLVHHSRRRRSWVARRIGNSPVDPQIPDKATMFGRVREVEAQ
jgi:hypothetical protein